MSAEFINGSWIANAISTPKVTNQSCLRGDVKEAVGRVTPAAAAEVASIYRMCRIPSGARITDILLKNLAFASGAMDIGVYQTTDNGGAVVNVDLFASALVMSGAHDKTNQVYESTEVAVVDAEKALWQLLGLSVDPNIEYDIAFTVTTQFGTALPMALFVRYVA